MKEKTRDFAFRIILIFTIAIAILLSPEVVCSFHFYSDVLPIILLSEYGFTVYTSEQGTIIKIVLTCMFFAGALATAIIVSEKNEERESQEDGLDSAQL